MTVCVSVACRVGRWPWAHTRRGATFFACQHFFAIKPLKIIDLARAHSTGGRKNCDSVTFLHIWWGRPNCPWPRVPTTLHATGVCVYVCVSEKFQYGSSSVTVSVVIFLLQCFNYNFCSLLNFGSCSEFFTFINIYSNLWNLNWQNHHFKLFDDYLNKRYFSEINPFKQNAEWLLRFYCREYNGDVGNDDDDDNDDVKNGQKF